MATSDIEVEATFAVPTDELEAPDLSGVDHVASASETTSFTLRATYFDTKDLRLTRAAITLRRRTGGRDEGWHLKLPGRGRARREIGVAIDAAPGVNGDGTVTLPAELRDLVRAVVRNEEIVPIAQVDNHRTETALVDKHRADIATFCDDRVRAASLLPGGTETSWREWELELSAELAENARGARVLDQVRSLVEEAGAHESDSPSKLLTALGDSLDTAPKPPQPYEFQAYDERDETFTGLVEALSAYRDALVYRDARARRREAGTVTSFMSAAVGLRLALRGLYELFEHDSWDERLDPVEAIDARLHAAAERAAESATRAGGHRELKERVDANSSGKIDEHTRSRLGQGSRAAAKRGHNKLVAELNSKAYIDALDALDRLLADPPVPSRRERRKAPAIIVRAVKRGYVAIKNRRKDLNSEPVLPCDDERAARLIDEAWRHAEELVAAAELAREYTAYRAEALAADAASFTALLRQVRQLSAAAELVAERAEHAAGRGESTFAYGVVYESLRERTAAVIRRADSEFKTLKKSYKAFRRSIEEP